MRLRCTQHLDFYRTFNYLNGAIERLFELFAVLLLNRGVLA